jgi:hypothetical protein
MLENIQVGDEVAVWRSSNYKGDQPTTLARVNKVTAKRIYTNGSDFWDRQTGLPLHSTKWQWGASGRDLRISADPADLKPLQDARNARIAEADRAQQAKIVRDNRKTYQLASEICASWNKDPIADLELLGEEYLQRIVDDIAKAKAEVGQ